jgi:hypothetical protein
MSQRDKTRKPNEKQQNEKRKQQNFQDSVQQKWSFCATESLQITWKRKINKLQQTENENKLQLTTAIRKIKRKKIK